jgi:hypothetical protein
MIGLDRILQLSYLHVEEVGRLPSISIKLGASMHSLTFEHVSWLLLFLQLVQERAEGGLVHCVLGSHQILLQHLRHKGCVGHAPAASASWRIALADAEDIMLEEAKRRIILVVVVEDIGC